MKSLFFLSITAILYTWMLYFLLLSFLSRFSVERSERSEAYPSVTVLLTVHNEEALIEKRVNNLLSQDYPPGFLEVLVASDASTDRTDEIVASVSALDPRVRLFKSAGGGKSATQNSAMGSATGDIVVLTDAGTLFRGDTVKQIARSFAGARVGCVSGRLMLNRGAGAVGESQGLYWNFETALRRMESRAGLLHTASGQVMAFRRSIFKPFASKYGDDCVIPLDIIIQGYTVVHAQDAVAYDSFPSSIRGELKARTRMTLRNITCTLSRYPLLNPFRYPLTSFAIFSHRILRWLTPFFMLGALFSNISLMNESRLFFLTGLLQCFFYVLTLVGFIGERLNVRIPIARQAFSFTLANAGFLLGVLKAAFCRSVTSYRN